MKILQVNNFYAEKSTGKITKALHEGILQSGNESVVVFGRGSEKSKENVIRLCPEIYGKINSFLSRFTGFRYGGCLLSTLRLEKIIEKEKPDIVHLQCINGNFVNIYRLIEWLKKKRIKTVVSLHAEFMYTANCGHAFECEQWKHGCKNCPNKKKAVKSVLFDKTGESWNRMKKAFEGFEKDCIICPVSDWTEERAKQSDILGGFKFRTVYNGTDAKNIFVPGNEKNEPKTVLSVTAHFSPEKEHPKGGYYLIKLAERMPETKFYVAGKADEIKNLPENIILMGEVENQENLARLYREAAVSVITSKKETFSMPCAESLCCGTPVIGFKAGAPEQIALCDYSEFVNFGDIDSLENILKKWLEKDISSKEIAEKAKEKYSAETMTESFLNIYRSILWN